MNEFRVELYIDGENEENIQITSLDEKEMEQWKIELETRALSEYYNRKIKISSKKV